MDLEQGDIVLCTVDRIVGTTVFVHIKDHGEGSIVFSEVAPGRIRNIRDYIVPKKQIVCKILRVSGDRVDLSLRRVTLKEQKEVKEIYKQEKNYKGILKGIMGNEADKAIEEISKKENIYDFFQEVKDSEEKQKELEKIIGKENLKKVIEILNTQKKKKTSLKKEISLKAPIDNGLEVIKELLGNIKDVDVKYIAAGRYILKTEAEDVKKADQELTVIITNLEKQAKNRGVEFSITKK